MIDGNGSWLDPLRIVIVGLGPRGLNVLERLLTLAPLAKAQCIEVTIFEPKHPGTGLHDLAQPDYLRLNTIACQLSMFPDRAAVDSEYERPGPNLYEWCRLRNVMVFPEATSGLKGERLVQPTDFLPRRLAGEYLSWFFQSLLASCPENVDIRVRRELAVSLRRTEVGFAIRGESGFEAEAQRLFVSVGHVGRRTADESGRVKRIYPLPDTVRSLGPTDTVALEGFGLSSIDVIAALTVGRGGQFSSAKGRVGQYLASGREPRISLYSRSGIPFRVRPHTSAHRKRHAPLFLSPDVIAELRSNRCDRRLDFQEDVMPLMELEMRAAFYIAQADVRGVPNSASLRNSMLQAFRAGEVLKYFAKLDIAWSTFEPKQYLLFSVPPGVTADSYPGWVRRFIEQDLAEGEKGLLESPLKASLEVWRDLRDVLRTIVDYAGLTEISQRFFYQKVAPLVNRIVGGPQLERHRELLALIDAGIVRIAPWTGWPGDCVSGAHWLVQGRTHRAGLMQTDSDFIRSATEVGFLRPFRLDIELDGVDVDKQCHPINRVGQPEKSMWVLGPLAEGATYYNHYIPSSGSFSRAFSDAHHSVIACLGLPVTKPGSRLAGV
jgi:uncharacterized NAD(P)/FAD-binding protein YdhS